MQSGKQNVTDPVAIGLLALAWTLEDQARADRMLAMTGLTAADLRERATEAAVLASMLAFLEGYEPDLIGCASAMGLAPAKLVDAREMLER